MVISVQAVGGVLVAAPDLNVEDKLNFYGASRAGKEKICNGQGISRKIYGIPHFL